MSASDAAGRCSARAELAERAVRARHLRPLWLLPGTLLAVPGWPATPAQRAFGPWNYWWQAHVLDCLVDAYVRAPDPQRRLRVSRFVNGVRRRNGRGWRNDYYDDMAWLALALQRAEQYVGVRRPGAVATLAEALRGGWTQDAGGGIWWRTKEKYAEDFKNVPANGPAAILFARLRDQRAYAVARWIERHLVDPATGVVWDGLHVGPDGGIREIETTRYTYCHGVYLGACLELAAWGDDGDPAAWAERAARTVDAVVAHLTVPADPKPDPQASHDPQATPGPEASPGPDASADPQASHDPEASRLPDASDGPEVSRLPDASPAPDASPVLDADPARADRAARANRYDSGGSGAGAVPLVLRGQGGGDGGLFAGILARYLAQAALTLPDYGPGFARTAYLAADVVLDSAEAAWDHRAPGPDGPVFGPEWSRRAEAPRRRLVPERDLSVQVGGWMVLEAAALLARSL